MNRQGPSLTSLWIVPTYCLCYELLQDNLRICEYDKSKHCASHIMSYCIPWRYKPDSAIFLTLVIFDVNSVIFGQTVTQYELMQHGCFIKSTMLLTI